MFVCPYGSAPGGKPRNELSKKHSNMKLNPLPKCTGVLLCDHKF